MGDLVRRWVSAAIVSSISRKWLIGRLCQILNQWSRLCDVIQVAEAIRRVTQCHLQGCLWWNISGRWPYGWWILFASFSASLVWSSLMMLSWGPGPVPHPMSPTMRPFLGLGLSQASKWENVKSVKGENACFCFYASNLHLSWCLCFQYSGSHVKMPNWK